MAATRSTVVNSITSASSGSGGPQERATYAGESPLHDRIIGSTPNSRRSAATHVHMPVADAASDEERRETLVVLRLLHICAVDHQEAGALELARLASGPKRRCAVVHCFVHIGATGQKPLNTVEMALETSDAVQQTDLSSLNAQCPMAVSYTQVECGCRNHAV